jgi:hypothetical protein
LAVGRRVGTRGLANARFRATGWHADECKTRARLGVASMASREASGEGRFPPVD